MIVPSPSTTVMTSLLFCTSDRNRCSLRSSSAVRSLDALLEVRRERQVLEQHRDLADDGQQDERERVPTEEPSEPSPNASPNAAEHDGEHDGHVRHEHGELVGNVVVGLCGSTPDAAPPGEEDRRERAEPADVDQAARRVRPAVREVHEAAVGDGEREQPGEEQRPVSRCPIDAVASDGSTRTGGW